MNTRGERRLLSALAVLIFLSLTGCVAKKIVGQDTTYAIAGWITWSFVLLGLMLICVGWLVYRLKKNLGTALGGIALMTLAPLVSWMVAYTTTREYLTINDQQVEFWSGGAHGEKRIVRLADCDHLEFELRETIARRGKTIPYTMPCFIMKNGAKEEINLFVIRGEGLDDLLRRLTAKGIPVVGNRREL